MITARAAVLTEPGKPLDIRDIHIREPEHGEVLIRTARAGICGTDLWFAQGRYPYPVPTVLGHEASGVIERLGPGITDLAVGDRVLVCDQMPCGRCGNCLTGRMVYCTDTTAKERQRGRLRLDQRPMRQFLGVSAFADVLLVDRAGVIPVPDDLSFDAAALLGCCLTTGCAAVFNTARIGPGSTVLVLGCGGVGLGAVQAARIAGATRIIAADPQRHRRAAASTLGATDTLDPRDGDLLDAVDVLLGGRGVDAAIEAVGTRETAEHAYAVLAPGGTAVIIGMMPPQDYLRIPAADLRHGRTLTGSVMGEVRTHHDIPRYISLAQGRALDSDHLATAHYPLDDVNVALDHARARTGIRTMITF